MGMIADAVTLSPSKIPVCSLGGSSQDLKLSNYGDRKPRGWKSLPKCS